MGKFSIKVIGGGVFLKNKPQTITITWEIKDEDGNKVIPDKLWINNIIQDPATTSKTYNRVYSDVDFTVKAIKDDIVAIGITTARFLGPNQTVEDSLNSSSNSIALSANQGKVLNEKIDNASNKFKGLFTTLIDLKKKIRTGEEGDWAIVGESIPANIFRWGDEGWESTGGTYDGTVDLTPYTRETKTIEYTDDYNVSKNHTHVIKVYDVINWATVTYDPTAPVYKFGDSYDEGEVVNMIDDIAFSYKALSSTATAPYLTQESNAYTLEDAITLLPEELATAGQKISFYNIKEESWMTYVFTGGDHKNATFWEVFTNNVDKDINNLQNQINESNNKFNSIDNKFTEVDKEIDNLDDKIDNVDSHILLSSTSIACGGEDIELVADRAYKDSDGNIITDTYVTREGLTNSIIDITNQQVTDLKPGSVDPEDLSEATKQLLGNKFIVNLPDEEDITTKDQLLKLKDKEYSPKDYSGMGRKRLRKHYVNGVNVLTQHMINKPNTIYIIEYDYCLADQTIEVPENCVLDFQGGSLKNGKIIFNNTVIESKENYIFRNLVFEGTTMAKYIYTEWFGAIPNESTDCTDAFISAVKFSDCIKRNSNLANNITSGDWHNAQSKINHCTIALCQGVYILSREWLIDKPVNIYGNGATIKAGNNFNGDSLINIPNTVGYTQGIYKDFILEGNNNQIIGLITYSNTSFYSNIYIKDCFAGGIQCNRANTFSGIKIVVTSSIGYDNREDLSGIYGMNITSSDGYITNMEIVNYPICLRIGGVGGWFIENLHVWGKEEATSSSFKGGIIPRIGIYSEGENNIINNFYGDTIIKADANLDYLDIVKGIENGGMAIYEKWNHVNFYNNIIVYINQGVHQDPSKISTDNLVAYCNGERPIINGIQVSISSRSLMNPELVHYTSVSREYKNVRNIARIGEIAEWKDNTLDQSYRIRYSKSETSNLEGVVLDTRKKEGKAIENFFIQILLYGKQALWANFNADNVLRCAWNNLTESYDNKERVKSANFAIKPEKVICSNYKAEDYSYLFLDKDNNQIKYMGYGSDGPNARKVIEVIGPIGKAITSIIYSDESVDFGGAILKASQFRGMCIDSQFNIRCAPLLGNTTLKRPTENIPIGLMYFDTTLSKPIWWTGTNWVDATGTTV